LKTFIKYPNNKRLFESEIADALKTNSEYLQTWFSDRALREISYYRSLINQYKNKDLLKVILSRAARSSRLIKHYDLARPEEPVRSRYWCIKHKRYCDPVNEAYKFIERYRIDTIERIKAFDDLRSDTFIQQAT
jgi:hypothetical protein